MYEFKLPDMTCGHCVAAITKTVQALDSSAKLEFDREARILRVESEKGRELFVAALTEEGYPPA
ncbi:heavy-metal-associated domain-containing protein [Roseateles oligotrophus]|uniref:Heavy-metal-associated domain-containing protein n=1 Tax=Roseateles oligotrophus TaxID=1769250 RepID=A0ABT2YIC1_9BURK|nr:heavy-metal-associated domain-containing protein [Roseateles oligotrophus]MCV2369810.1 heavy-metal-associated domain-containing protein [Roseateles oligotrophus]